MEVEKRRPEEIGRREFLKRTGLLAAGLVVGYETSNQLAIPSEIFDWLSHPEVVEYLVEEMSRRPVNLGVFGSDMRIPGMERSVGMPVHRKLDFFGWHGGRDYLRGKVDFLREQLNFGRIPGVSMTMTNPNSQLGEFRYGSHSYYDETHRPYLQALAQELRLLEIPVELAFFEPNIKPEPPEEYADLFRYVVDVFRKERADYVVFTMYLSAQFPMTRHMIKDYYPGHEYIDKFGFSIYDLYQSNPLHFNHWVPGKMSAWSLAWPWLKPALEVTEGRVPLVIAEVGTGRDSREEAADWLVEMVEICYALGIGEMNYFNVDFKWKYTGNMLETAGKWLDGKVTAKKVNWGERNWVIGATAEDKKVFRERFKLMNSKTDRTITLEGKIGKLGEYVQRDFGERVMNTARKVDVNNVDYLREQEKIFEEGD